MTLVATLVEFKAWLKYGAGTTEDTKLTDVLTAASEWAEWRIGGPLSVTSITESAHTNGRSITPRKTPLVTATSITPEESSTALDATSYKVDTTNGLIRFYWGVPPGWYTLVYTAGLATITSRVKTAGLEVARHLWLVENGSAVRGFPTEDTVMTPMGFAVPARAEELLAQTPLIGIA